MPLKIKPLRRAPKITQAELMARVRLHTNRICGVMSHQPRRFSKKKATTQ